MHCVVMSSEKGNHTWSVWRTVEVLAYHKEERCVRILFLILAKNNSVDSGPNYLKLLHRGNVECTLLPPWPLPRHYDEGENTKGKVGAVQGILEDLYGKVFSGEEAPIVLSKCLTPWDSFVEISERIEVRAGPDLPAGQGGFPLPMKLDADQLRVDECSYRPFTTWTVGPFNHAGMYLIAFSLNFTGETYADLVERSMRIATNETDASGELAAHGERIEVAPGFSVDGPQRLLALINYLDLPLSRNEQERKDFITMLEPFQDEDKRIEPEAYDVVILNYPLADPVEVDSEAMLRNSIYEAPLQASPLGRAKRFITVDNCFTIGLKYVNGRQSEDARLVSVFEDRAAYI